MSLYKPPQSGWICHGQLPLSMQQRLVESEKTFGVRDIAGKPFELEEAQKAFRFHVYYDPKDELLNGIHIRYLFGPPRLAAVCFSASDERRPMVTLNIWFCWYTVFLVRKSHDYYRQNPEIPDIDA